MLKLLKKSIIKTNDCIIVGVPLIVFLSIINWYVNYARDNIDTLPKFLVALITVLVLISGCFSGWYYMVKKALQFSSKTFIFDADRIKALWSLVSSIPKGIGRLFLSLFASNLIQLLLYSFLLFVVVTVLNFTLGGLNADIIDLDLLSVSSVDLTQILYSLPINDLNYFNYVFLIMGVLSLIISYFTILWIPVMVYENKNPFKALFIAVKRAFDSPISHFVLCLIIFAIHLLISAAMFILLSINVLFFILLLMIYYYFYIYITVLLFIYYENTFINGEQ